MNGPNLERFVNAIASDLEEGGFREVTGTTLRRNLTTAVQAALPLLKEQEGGGHAQPGGRVRLGDQAERARFEAFLSRNPLMALCAGTAWQVWQAALSAQPSPGGQDARAQFEAYRGGDFERDAQGYYTNARTAQDWAMWQAALAARQPVGEPVAEVVEIGGVKRLRVYPDAGLHALLQFPVGTRYFTAPPAQAVDLVQPLPLIARALAEWHEDDGNVLWWAWCGRGWAGEPAWAGTPNDSDWPGYHTHWTPHPNQPALIDSQAVGNVQALQLDRYDAGLLSDVGGGDTAWWLNYLRSELARAHDHYQHQVNPAKEAGNG
ncbi:hypothetical protein [Stenotrophomonas sp. NRRL B-14846]|uniref:hypothetical protein n=1 Tax=Stenotrophomonas sp. NRRL B-14846 TaxID=3162882 RepID=UPI003D26D530